MGMKLDTQVEQMDIGWAVKNFFKKAHTTAETSLKVH